jgi:hypothetical protein
VQVEAVGKGMTDAVAGQWLAKYCFEAAVTVGIAEWLAGSEWLFKQIPPWLLPQQGHDGSMQQGVH